MNCQSLTTSIAGSNSLIAVAGVLALIALASQSLVLLLSTICVGLLALVVCLVIEPVSKPARCAGSANGWEEQTESESPETMISMVALFDELPFVDEAVLVAHVKRAWGLELGNDHDDESFAAGWAPLFVVKTPHQMYAINYRDQNYFDNLEEVLDEVTELRLSKAIGSHKAWISVDLVSDSQNLGSAFHYAMIGRLLNQMINQDCVALMLPDQMKLLPWDESFEKALDSGRPLEDLCPSQPPVLPIDNDHPELVAAVTMARNRFSQFVTAFENHQRNEDRDPKRQFAVKAPITVAGRTEFMWVATTAIENGILYGTLDNQPVSLPGLNLGDQVRFAIAELNDWVYTLDDRTFGGFTTHVINRWAREQSSPAVKRA